MLRKDYDKVVHEFAHRRGGLMPTRAIAGGLAGLMVLVWASSVDAGSVRLLPSAVVVDDTILLSDLCELRQFDVDTESRLAKLSVSEAPPPGGSRIIHINTVRTAIAAGGVNMAGVTLRGAIECAVTRPTITKLVRTFPTNGGLSVGMTPSGFANHAGNAVREVSVNVSREGHDSPSLRDAVISYFHRELRRYGGRPEVQFDHTSEQVLALSGPTYTFDVRGRNKVPLGLNSLEVDVVADGAVVQTVPLVVQVRMLRKVVIARRPINQGATIRAEDVDHVSLTFTRTDKLGVNDPALVIGQRAKRFISPGTMVDPEALESVPLVMRGQLVTLESIAGAVRVVTTAKATRDGLLGEMIKVRAADNKRIEFDAVVVGPGRVQIGNRPVAALRIAMGGGS